MSDKELTPRTRASLKYNKENVYQFKCSFNKKTDKAIIEHLTAQPNKQGYIKKLILDDMGKEANQIET